MGFQGNALLSLGIFAKMRKKERAGWKMAEGKTFQKVYEIVRQIPKGKVTTYGQIACLIGNPRLSRAVGYALHINPEPGVIPCHRVVNRFGGLSEAFAFGGENQQRILLESEGVVFLPDGRVDLQSHFWMGPQE